MTARRTLALLLGLCTSALAAMAGIPAPYAPAVTLPTGTPQRYEFDLTTALRRARREHKRLYVYLGADDCAYCRKYEAFLHSNATELAPHFAKDYLVVDLRSSLSVQADRLYFRVGEKACPMPISCARSATSARACWSIRASGCSTPTPSR